MPLRSTTAFDPETVEMLQRVLEDACRWLTGKDGKEPDDATRTAIALRIMECAKAGETDPQKIVAYALAHLTALVTEQAESAAKPE
jgi:hypothetical protein